MELYECRRERDWLEAQIARMENRIAEANLQCFYSPYEREIMQESLKQLRIKHVIAEVAYETYGEF